MFSYVFSSATTYFHLPIDDKEHQVDGRNPKPISWVPDPDHPSISSSHPQSPVPHLSTLPFAPTKPGSERVAATVDEVLAKNDLYEILGISNQPTLDKIAIRRAYLSRSKACHPDKFPDNPEATHAFQKVSVAYDVLSKPSSKRVYDSRQSSSPYNFFSTQPAGHAEETFRGVIIGVFNDFLDGDLEMIRTLLRAVNDINPSLRLSEDSINAVLGTLQSIRERALTCRTCVFVLHAELSRLLELQHSFRQLSYIDLVGRSRLTIQLTRVTISLPIVLEKALRDEKFIYGHQRNVGVDVNLSVLPRHVDNLIRCIDVILERMERMLK
ncbi:hypothetical protein PILCRDRAFT_410890 [Piloderma croceum F 1598]|uniref:J domain-containing protein n=1 Tax=Piloderma croceum (strain F 1598) TaxID=765440 RepID=A0A0C3FXV3_PILCF|nr:hypothetical protein PILCRDRAFT_410890 [Piloderma croceum F 1598]